MPPKHQDTIDEMIQDKDYVTKSNSELVPDAGKVVMEEGHLWGR
jgi:hypothetical protein